MASTNLNAVLAALGYTEREFIEDILAAAFIVDFGIIVSVSSDMTHVDVQHAIEPLVAGTQLGATETRNVEVLWPGGGGQYSEKWDLVVGDPVLLVGLKDFVDTVASNLPSIPDVPIHYVQETLKAIPFGAYKGSTITLQMTAGKWKLVATEIDLNGSTHTFVLGDSLATAFGVFLTALNLQLVNAGQPGGLSLSIPQTTTVKTGG